MIGFFIGFKCFGFIKDDGVFYSGRLWRGGSGY